MPHKSDYGVKKPKMTKRQKPRKKVKKGLKKAFKSSSGKGGY